MSERLTEELGLISLSPLPWTLSWDQGWQKWAQGSGPAESCSEQQEGLEGLRLVGVFLVPTTGNELPHEVGWL